MKRCPECDSRFSDTDKFCELDGTQLVADYSNSDDDSLGSSEDEEEDLQGTRPNEIAGAVAYHDSTGAGAGQSWKILAIVAVVGIAIGAIMFVLYQRTTRESPEQLANESSTEAVPQQQAPFLISPPTPSASPSPSAEPSPSPSAMPSPTAQAASARVALSSSPVSTGGSENTRSGPVTIQLTNGTSVEADEVWETGEGIWYRRRGIVSLLNRNQVKAIDKEPKSAPSPAATPTASPSTSP